MAYSGDFEPSDASISNRLPRLFSPRRHPSLHFFDLVTALRSNMKNDRSVGPGFRQTCRILIQYTLGTLTLRPCHVDADSIVTQRDVSVPRGVYGHGTAAAWREWEQTLTLIQVADQKSVELLDKARGLQSQHDCKKPPQPFASAQRLRDT